MQIFRLCTLRQGDGPAMVSMGLLAALTQLIVQSSWRGSPQVLLQGISSTLDLDEVRAC